MFDNSFRKIRGGFLSILFAVVALLFVPTTAEAANRYWVGSEGGDTNDTANWASANPASCTGGGASVPGAADVAIFDPDCDTAATVNADFSVLGVNMNAGYTGTITQAPGVNITIGTTDWIQSDGTFVAGNGTITFNDVMNIAGGTFTAGTGTIVLSGGASTITPGTALAVSNLTISSTSTKTIANSNAFVVNGTLTLTDGLVSQTTIPSTGTIRAQGNVIQNSTFDGGTARLVIDGTGDQALIGNATRTAGLLPLLRINKASGTLTMSGTVRTAAMWGYSGGTLAFTNSTVVFSDAALTIAGTHSLSNVIFDQNSVTARTYTIKSDTTLTVLGDLTLDNSSTGIITINGGFIRARGNIYLPDSTMNHTGTTNLIIDGTTDQMLSGNAATSTGGFLPLTINKSSGTLTLSGTIRTGKGWSYSGGTLDTGSSTVIFGGTLTIAGSHTLNNVRFDGFKTSTTTTITAATTLTVGGDLTFDQGGNLGTLTINTGTIEAKGDVFTLDTLNHTGTASLWINGTGSQLLAGNASATAGGFLGLTIDKSSGTLTLSGTIRTLKNWTYTAGNLDATTNDSTVVFGTALQISGSHTLDNLIFNGTNSNFSLVSGTTITTMGTLTLRDGRINTGTIDAQGGVVHFIGFDGGDATVAMTGTATRSLSLSSGALLPGITLAGANTTIVGSNSGIVILGGSYTQSAGTFSGDSGALFVRGDFCQTGGSFTAPSGQLSVGGDFCADGGTFAHNNGTLLLTGTSRTFLPPASLYNVILKDGLVGYWNMDDIDGTIVADSSKYGHDGVVVDSPTLSVDVAPVTFSNPGSLSFDGVNDAVLIDNRGKFHFGPEKNFTMATWVKRGSTSTNQSMILNAAGNGAGRYWFGVTDLSSVNGSLWMNTHWSGAHDYYLQGSSTFNDLDWHHVTWVVDKVGRFQNIYIDGVRTNSGSMLGSETNRPGSLSIAGPIDGGFNYFNGTIDDFRIYSRALAASEVAELAAGSQYTDSDITFTLEAPLTVAGTLTLDNITLDDSSSNHAISYGSLVSNGGSIATNSTASVSSSSAAQASVANRSGGGGRRGSPGRGGTAPQIYTSDLVGTDSSVGDSTFSTVLSFRDIPNNAWFYDAVYDLASRKIIAGYTDTQGRSLNMFGPADPVTVGQILKIALLATGHELPVPAGVPSNRTATDWSAPYVALAESLKLTLASADVSLPATRGQVIRLLMEAADIDVSAATANPFSDLNLSDPNAPYILAAAKLGIVTGDTRTDGSSAGTVRPDDTINRAETAALVMRLIRSQ